MQHNKRVWVKIRYGVKLWGKNKKFKCHTINVAKIVSIRIKYDRGLNWRELDKSGLLS